MKRYAGIAARWGVFISALCFVPMREAYGLAESTGAGGSNCIAVHQLGEIGEGVNVGLILSGNVRTTHEAFEDRTPAHANHGDGNVTPGPKRATAALLLGEGSRLADASMRSTPSPG